MVYKAESAAFITTCTLAGRPFFLRVAAAHNKRTQRVNVARPESLRPMEISFEWPSGSPGLANVSIVHYHMITGWKSILLKPVDPFFSKHDAGTQLPVKIMGTRSKPLFGLDFGHKN